MSRGGKLAVFGLALVVLVAGGWYLVTAIRDAVTPKPGPGPECVVQVADAAQPVSTVALADSTVLTGTASSSVPTLDDALSLAAVQLQHASTINAVGLRRGIPERGRIIALATALQESSLRNLPNGDLDSVGLFQQRPSQGWGTAAQVGDPIFASNAFYDALLDVPDWESESLTDAAQAVQYSAFPDAYAKWEPAATHLVDALSGTDYALTSCRAGATAPTTDAPDREPLAGSETASVGLRDVLAAAEAELGGLTVTELSSDGKSATLTADIAELSDDAAAAVLATWTVAHGTSGNVAAVAVAGDQWSNHAWGAATAGPLPAGQVRIAVS